MTRRASVAIMLAALVVVVGATSVAHAVPQFVNYSGRFSDGTGWGMSTEATITVTLWSCCEPSEASCQIPCAPGVGALWTERYEQVPVNDGYFSVLLGEGDDPQSPGERVHITDHFTTNAQTWLSIAIDDGPDLSPRQMIGSVPYAVRADGATSAETANTIRGYSAQTLWLWAATATASRACSSAGAVYAYPILTMNQTASQRCSAAGRTCVAGFYINLTTSGSYVAGPGSTYCSTSVDIVPDINNGADFGAYFACCQ